MSFSIDYYPSVGSTMDVAREYIGQGNDDHYVVQAGMQTGGRGRRGNQWVSPAGNLYQSIILKPQRPRHEWGQMSFVVAVALADVCLDSGIEHSSLHLKWPNDVLINEQKLAGILIEIEQDSLIIGTGVNVEIAPEERSKFHDWCDWSIDECRDAFLQYLDRQFHIWNEQGFDIIRERWMSHAFRVGEMIQARTPKEIYTGVFETLDDNGVLILRQNDNTVLRINSGEIIACS